MGVFAPPRCGVFGRVDHAPGSPTDFNVHTRKPPFPMPSQVVSTKVMRVCALRDHSVALGDRAARALVDTKHTISHQPTNFHRMSFSGLHVAYFVSGSNQGVYRTAARCCKVVHAFIGVRTATARVQP